MSAALDDATLASLRPLPRRKTLVLEGGRRLLPTQVQEGAALIQPEMVLWVEQRTGLVRAFTLLVPGGDAVAAFVETAVRAMLDPTPPGKPGVPAKLVVADEGVASALQTALRPLQIPVAAAPDLPRFEAAAHEFAEFLRLSQEGNRWGEDVDRELIRALYAAAAGVWRRAPWDYLADHPPIEIRLSRPDAEPLVLYAAVLGAAGEVFGVAFYPSLEAYEHAREAGAAVDEAEARGRQVVPEAIGVTLDQLAVWFEDESELAPERVEEVRAAGYPLASRAAYPVFIRLEPGRPPRLPNAGEAPVMLVALEALSRFFSRFRRRLLEKDWPVDGRFEVEDPEGPVQADLALPPPEPPAPARRRAQVPARGRAATKARQRGAPAAPPAQVPVRPAAGRTAPAGQPGADAPGIYRFKVTLLWRKGVWRRIDVRADQTLVHLHDTIQQAFGWDNDHLWSFFLSGKAWDASTEYSSPGGEGRSARVKLSTLGLQPKRRFLYLFDYGDELRHEVVLESILPGPAQGRYPRIVESHGEAPPQYPGEDDEEDEGEAMPGP